MLTTKEFSLNRLYFFKVVQVCWENQLYDAVIYVFNRGMNDYTTPMEVSTPYVIHTCLFHTDKEQQASQQHISQK